MRATLLLFVCVRAWIVRTAVRVPDCLGDAVCCRRSLSHALHGWREWLQEAEDDICCDG